MFAGERCISDSQLFFVSFTGYPDEPVMDCVLMGELLTWHIKECETNRYVLCEAPATPLFRFGNNTITTL